MNLTWDLVNEWKKAADAIAAEKPDRRVRFERTRTAEVLAALCEDWLEMYAMLNTAKSAKLADAERLDWLGQDPSRMNDVYGRMINEDEPIRVTIDWMRMIEAGPQPPVSTKTLTESAPPADKDQ